MVKSTPTSLQPSPLLQQKSSGPSPLETLRPNLPPASNPATPADPSTLSGRRLKIPTSPTSNTRPSTRKRTSVLADSQKSPASVSGSVSGSAKSKKRVSDAAPAMPKRQKVSVAAPPPLPQPEVLQTPVQDFVARRQPDVQPAPLAKNPKLDFYMVFGNGETLGIPPDLLPRLRASCPLFSEVLKSGMVNVLGLHGHVDPAHIHELFHFLRTSTLSPTYSAMNLSTMRALCKLYDVARGVGVSDFMVEVLFYLQAAGFDEELEFDGIDGGGVVEVLKEFRKISVDAGRHDAVYGILVEHVARHWKRYRVALDHEKGLCRALLAADGWGTDVLMHDELCAFEVYRGAAAKENKEEQEKKEEKEKKDDKEEFKNDVMLAAGW
ncbi:hypothetical protein EDC01DRAFT_761464 [Geopyxis carbonaria]|nr:hypothetical protein EDC01DRAFT_761464 [Geopyxis carbonaria]